MNITQLKCIYAIAQEKNLSRAAEKSYISQSSLSQYLTKLEFELGIQLFNRKKWEPTEAGQIYLDAASTIIETHEKALKEIGALVASEKNTISIGMSSERAAIILSQIYEPFHKKYPNVTITLREDHALPLQQMAANNQIDLAFSALSFLCQTEIQSKLNCIPICTEELVLIVPTSHPLARNTSPDAGQPINLEKLSGEDFICHTKIKALRRILDDIFDSYHIVPRNIIECTSAATIIEFVSANMGISIVPIMFAKRCSSVKIIPTEPKLSWPVGILYSKDNKLTSAENQLIAYLKEAFSAFNNS